MYKFYDEDANGKWHEHQFTEDEAGCGFIILFTIGIILPIIIAICNI